jgi:hypothetical protein
MAANLEAALCSSAQQQLLQQLRWDNRYDCWRSILPAITFAVFVSPLLGFTISNWLSTPGSTALIWLVECLTIVIIVLCSGALSLFLAKWAALRGYTATWRILQCTDLLLYALMRDTHLAPFLRSNTLFHINTIGGTSRRIGSFAERITRLAVHFNHWCTELQITYPPQQIRNVKCLITIIQLLIILLLFGLSQTTKINSTINVIWIALPVIVFYQSSLNCGMRIGARRALMRFLTEEN